LAHYFGSAAASSGEWRRELRARETIKRGVWHLLYVSYCHKKKNHNYNHRVWRIILALRRPAAASGTGSCERGKNSKGVSGTSYTYLIVIKRKITTTTTAFGALFWLCGGQQRRVAAGVASGVKLERGVWHLLYVTYCHKKNNHNYNHRVRRVIFAPRRPAAASGDGSCEREKQSKWVSGTSYT